MPYLVFIAKCCNMSLIKKIRKAKRFFMRFAVLKTVYWRYRLHLRRESSFHICPKSIVEIDKSANVSLGRGEVTVNDTWFMTRKRRYTSEFRLDKDSTFICEGDFRLFQGASIYVAPRAKLILHGGGSFLNTNSTLNCFQHIEIGDGCSISDNVCIADSDSHRIDGDEAHMMAPVIIGDHVWICKNVTILKGVHIGDGAVVGAGSVVTKDVPAHTVVAGNPARPIKTITNWE